MINRMTNMEDALLSNPIEDIITKGIPRKNDISRIINVIKNNKHLLQAGVVDSIVSNDISEYRNNSYEITRYNDHCYDISTNVVERSPNGTITRKEFKSGILTKLEIIVPDVSKTVVKYWDVTGEEIYNETTLIKPNDDILLTIDRFNGNSSLETYYPVGEGKYRLKDGTYKGRRYSLTDESVIEYHEFDHENDIVVSAIATDGNKLIVKLEDGLERTVPNKLVEFCIDVSNSDIRNDITDVNREKSTSNFDIDIVNNYIKEKELNVKIIESFYDNRRKCDAFVLELDDDVTCNFYLDKDNTYEFNIPFFNKNATNRINWNVIICAGVFRSIELTVTDFDKGSSMYTRYRDPSIMTAYCLEISHRLDYVG